MYAEAQQALRDTGAEWARVSQAGAALVDDIRSAIQIDAATGEVSFTGDRLDRLLQETTPNAQRDIADELRRQLALGFAPFPDGAGIPWFALTDPGYLRTVGQSYWDWLAIPPGAGTGDVLNRLSEQYPRVPDAISTPSNLQVVANGSAYSAVEQSLRQSRQAAGLALAATRRDRSGTPSFPLDIPAAALGATPPPRLISPGMSGGSSSLALPSFDQLGAAAWCFVTQTQWTVHGYGYIEICMDRTCADNILAVFSAMGALDFIAAIGTAIQAALASGVAAAALGFIASAGGWVAAAIMTFVAYWYVMINWNVTANGVCVFHRAPWAWWLPHFPPGWAQGR